MVTSIEAEFMMHKKPTHEILKADLAHRSYPRTREDRPSTRIHGMHVQSYAYQYVLFCSRRSRLQAGIGLFGLLGLTWDTWGTADTSPKTSPQFDPSRSLIFYPHLNKNYEQTTPSPITQCHYPMPLQIIVQGRWNQCPSISALPLIAIHRRGE